MLFVQNRQAQVFKLHIFLDQSVRADDDINTAIGQAFERLCLFFSSSKTGNFGNFDRPLGKAVTEVLVMLLGQQGGWHQHRHLTATHHGHKSSTQSDLSFTKANIATDQSIHGSTGLHVFDDVFNRLQLVWRFFKREALTECFVIMQTERKCMTTARSTLGIQIQQLCRRITNLLEGFFLGFVPLAATQAMQWRALWRAAGIT